MTATTTLDLPQCSVPVHIDGDGPPVLFVHGALVNHRLWDPVVDRLEGVRAIRPDLPLGSHTSACKPGADLSPPALARLIAQQKTVGDLITPSVPNRVVLDAPVVTKDNVEEFIDLSFES